MQPPPPLFHVPHPELLERAEEPKLATPELLDVEHLASLKTAIANILDTDIAEQTFSQIVDGLPTKSSFWELHYTSKDLGHPVAQHESLCEGILEKTRQFRADVDVLSLKFETSTLEAYQDSPRGSRAFALSLVEIIAVACHQIAVLLYQLGDDIHTKEYASWLAEETILYDNGHEKYKYYPLEPTAPFYHDQYYIHEQYPQGVADMVGYWAETMIFGGVVLFDRSDCDPDIKHVYIHEGRLRGPKTIYPLTSQQFDEIMAFLLPHGETPVCPLPIHGSPENRPRYDPYHAMKYFKIYRNRYERILPPKFWRKDVFSSKDYPELDDRRYLLLHLYEVGAGEAERDDELVKFYEDRLKWISPSSPLWSMGGDYE